MTMADSSSHYHDGERAVQARAGVRGLAERVAGSIRPSMPELARDFAAAARLAVLGGVDGTGRPWAAVVTGPPGLVATRDDRTLRLTRGVPPDDPLDVVLRPGAAVGLLLPDFATRRRMRVNGRVIARDDEGLVVRTEEVYANCPKYIHPRPDPPHAGLGTGAALTEATGLDDDQRAFLRRADTFFITTAHPDRGIDTSHRGGPAGFLSVEGDVLRWPDYPGNAMFNTLGNIEAHPRAGLAVPDFATGRVLQLSGRASIAWSASGAEREVVLHVEAVRDRLVSPEIARADNGSSAGPG
jgi:predicted pyridoxine 5'-phosphate oxidase superfamily flavin-nucleotide-binding protein